MEPPENLKFGSEIEVDDGPSERERYVWTTALALGLSRVYYDEHLDGLVAGGATAPRPCPGAAAARAGATWPRVGRTGRPAARHRPTPRPK